LIQVAISILKPPHGGFRSETAVALPFRKWNGNGTNLKRVCVTAIPPTEKIVRSGVTAM
jgi:hypothetical protein